MSSHSSVYRAPTSSIPVWNSCHVDQFTFHIKKQQVAKLLRNGDKQSQKDKDKQLTDISSYWCELLDWNNWWTKLKLDAIDSIADIIRTEQNKNWEILHNESLDDRRVEF